MTVEQLTMGWNWQTLMARLERDSNQRRAERARRFAFPDEPHAKSRARILAAEQDFQRRMGRALIYGEES